MLLRAAGIARTNRREIARLAGTRSGVGLPTRQKIANFRTPNSDRTPSMTMPCRGVYEEKITPPGERWFKVVTSSGKVGTVHLPAELVDEALTENLWRRLDKHDPAVKLQIVG